MLISETFEDIATSYGTTLRVYVISPRVPGYPRAVFPGVILYSEIYQVTGPVRRFAQQIASRGYVVVLPSVYHNFTGPEPLAYDAAGTHLGNEYKAQKPLASYDEDTRLCCDLLQRLPQCDGRIGATGMCLGGHLAFRALLDARVSCATCFFPTDIHSRTLGAPAPDDSLERVCQEAAPGQELLLIFGTWDTHVPPAGRDLVRASLREHGVAASFLELHAAQHAFVRDEFSKGRFDGAVTASCLGLMFEQFDRLLKHNLGPREADAGELEHVC
ncbi:AaceriADR265Cp [[Ashbya] aceris (nom. inval.)]|nr:AaceriADR265Cp [[Ashbya] aceris (nom. inval.)]